MIANAQDVQAVILGKATPALIKDRCSTGRLHELYFTLEIRGGNNINIRTASFTERDEIVMLLIKQLALCDDVELVRNQICSLGPGDTFIIQIQQKNICNLSEREIEREIEVRFKI